MAKADLELALVKAQVRSPLTLAELSELLNVDIGELITEHQMDLYQAEAVMMWRKREVLRHSHQRISFPEKLEESNIREHSRLSRITEGVKEGAMQKNKRDI